MPFHFHQPQAYWQSQQTAETALYPQATAALARWGAQAIHKGNFKEEFGIDVDCYVLNDPTKTAVISQRGMGAALGLGVGGSRLPMFVNSKRISSYVGHELRKKLENPLVFQAPSAGINSLREGNTSMRNYGLPWPVVKRFLIA